MICYRVGADAVAFFIKFPRWRVEARKNSIFSAISVSVPVVLAHDALPAPVDNVQQVPLSVDKPQKPFSFPSVPLTKLLVLSNEWLRKQKHSVIPWGIRV